MEASEIMDFNPDMLVVGRESRLFSQSALAKKARLSQGMLSKIENHLVDGSIEVWTSLAAALEYPLDFFRQTDSVYGLPPTFHRKRQSVGVRALRRIHSEMNIVRMHVTRLMRATEATFTRTPVPELDVEEYGSPAAVAQMLRRIWLVNDGPIRELVGLLESGGILIVPMDFHGEKVDAVGWAVPGLPPLIFADFSVPTDRLRFTLAHELAHLIMHRIPSDTMEDEANGFAAEFLAPARDIRGQLNRLSLQRLAQLKLVWRISMAALLFRARTLKKISPRQYRYFWSELSRRGWKTREPESTDPPPEAPTLLRHMFERHFTDLGYSSNDLADALHATTKDIERLYPRFGSLRLVG